MYKDGRKTHYTSRRAKSFNHCIVYALSDPKDADYQSTCSHHHNDCCSQCNVLAVVIDEIEKAIEKTVIGPEDISKEVNDELTFLTEKAKRDVNAEEIPLIAFCKPG